MLQHEMLYLLQHYDRVVVTHRATVTRDPGPEFCKVLGCYSRSDIFMHPYRCWGSTQRTRRKLLLRIASSSSFLFRSCNSTIILLTLCLAKDSLIPSRTRNSASSTSIFTTSALALGSERRLSKVIVSTEIGEPAYVLSSA